MKKVFFIFIIFMFIFIIFYKKYEKNVINKLNNQPTNNVESEKIIKNDSYISIFEYTDNVKKINIDEYITNSDPFSSKGYICKNIDENKMCKIYFLNGIYQSYILLYENDDIEKTFIQPLQYSFNYNKFNDIEIKYDYDENNITINNNIKLIAEIINGKDKRLNGTYDFNNMLLEIEKFDFSTYGKLKSNAIEFVRGYGSNLTIIDKNIIVMMDSIISEYPIYYYYFDEKNNLILEPLVGNYRYVNRIKYILKRLN